MKPHIKIRKESDEAVTILIVADAEALTELETIILIECQKRGIKYVTETAEP